MRVSNEGSTSDVLDAFRWAEEVIGTEFDAKTALQEPQFRRDRMLALHFVRNFPLEAHFAAAREFYRNTGQLPPDRRSSSLRVPDPCAPNICTAVAKGEN